MKNESHVQTTETPQRELLKAMRKIHENEVRELNDRRIEITDELVDALRQVRYLEERVRGLEGLAERQTAELLAHRQELELRLAELTEVKYSESGLRAALAREQRAHETFARPEWRSLVEAVRAQAVARIRCCCGKDAYNTLVKYRNACSATDAAAHACGLSREEVDRARAAVGTANREG